MFNLIHPKTGILVVDRQLQPFVYSDIRLAKIGKRVLEAHLDKRLKIVEVK